MSRKIELVKKSVMPRGAPFSFANCATPLNANRKAAVYEQWQHQYCCWGEQGREYKRRTVM